MARDEEFPECRVLDGFPRPIVDPPGIYRARFKHYETAVTFNSPKAILFFEIISPGEHNGVEIMRAYPVKQVAHRKRRRSGAFDVSPGQDIFKDRCRLFGKLQRRDRFSLRPFKDRVFQVDIDWVTTDYRQREMARENWYSKVTEIIDVEAAQ